MKSMCQLNRMSQDVYLEIRDKQFKDENVDDVSYQIKYKSRNIMNSQKNKIRGQDYDKFCTHILSEELKKYDFGVLNKKFYNIKNRCKFKQLKNTKNVKQIGSKQKL